MARLVLIFALLLPSQALAVTDFVYWMQVALNRAGYDAGEPDGLAGQRTARAVSAYAADTGAEPTLEGAYAGMSAALERTPVTDEQVIEAVQAAAATFFAQGAKLTFGDLYTLPNGQICGRMDAPETPLLPAGTRFLMTIAEPVRIGEEYSAVVLLDENGMVEMHCTTGLIHTDARTPAG